jgi:hypothetical protein
MILKQINHANPSFEHICPFCKRVKITTNGGEKLHERSCSKNPNRVDGANKGFKFSEEVLNKSFRNNPKVGGLREGSGRGKKGWYKGFYCRSTWELA